jgi:hypothetical protein
MKPTITLTIAILALVVTLLGLAALPAMAEELTPADAVQGHDGVTYADLLKQVIPDLVEGNSGWTGHIPDDIGLIGGEGDSGELPDPTSITSMTAETVMSGGKPTLWVMADAGGGGMLGTYTLLAVFDDSASPKLIDAKEVDYDQFTYFLGDPLKISAQDEAIIADTSHSNSEQSYEERMLITLSAGRLIRVADFLLLEVHSCHLYQGEELALAPRSRGKGYWPIDATIKRSLARNAEDGDCLDPDNPAGLKTDDYRAAFKWDAAGGEYVTTSKALDRLREDDSNLF